MIEFEELKITKSVAAIIAAGKELFWQYGIKRITVEEICEQADVSKMTFYRNFNNKHELALRIFKEKVSENVEAYDEIMESQKDYPLKIKDLLELKRRESKNMSMEFLKDVYSGEEEFEYLKSFITDYSSKFLQKLKADFTKAQEEGNIRADLKIDLLIYMLNTMQQALEDRTLQQMYSNTEDLAMEITNLFFYGIVKRD